jgi:Zn-dependent protease
MDIAALIVWYVVFVLSTTCHEAAHAFAAHKGGDPTAYHEGHVTLDPMPHIRRTPFGMVVVPIASFLLNQGTWMIGWASVPYDSHWGIRHPRRAALMSLAGPGANLLLAAIAFAALQVLLSMGVFVPPTDYITLSKMVELPAGTPDGSPLAAVAMALSVMFSLNVILAVFNLLPFPPLDGAAVVDGFVPRARPLYTKLRELPMASVLGLVVAWKIFGWLIGPLFRTMTSLMY